MEVVTCVQAEAVQVLGSSVVVVPDVLSWRVTVAQSLLMLSWQTSSYQKLSWLAPLGMVKVWLKMLSPLVGVSQPATAAHAPVWPG